jgi:hypothetical protein
VAHPNLIAKKLGFQNYQEEIAHVRATGDTHPPGSLGWRSGYEDVEILDYAFISNTWALRIHSACLNEGVGVWRAEVIDLSAINRSAGNAEVHAVDGGYVYRGITGAFISTPTTFCEDDWISVTVLGLY